MYLARYFIESNKKYDFVSVYGCVN